MGLEVCATLGMLNPEQAKQLKAAGLTAYNHNLDTSPEYYPKVITTRYVFICGQVCVFCSCVVLLLLSRGGAETRRRRDKSEGRM